ncbi:MAG: acetate--CoA ligase family protein [Candidatus Aminicenantes bacterium]|nr:acetate--CoA ligase family protein [Candidatus Aminicenantes bacterium]MDH5706266.1 acetate--CoA ligase family protein [Candidatus Aminicenantes bacterium]
MKNSNITERLNSLFYPRSIAVIGASRQPGSVGQSLLANIIDSRYQGIVYPVNPKAKGILGIKCYRNVIEIPDVVDLAVIVVPSPFVLEVLEECGRKHIKGAIVISAGFKEIGGEGAELEEKVKKIIEKYGLSLVGPNCLGVINTDPELSMNATFGTKMSKEGNIALISQSGALCVAVLDYAKESNIGFSKFISMGNKAGLNENELLLYLKNDPKTDVILMYLEDLSKGREFMNIARETTNSPTNPKPIIALKAGRTLLGARAASSHTGSLAGSDKVYDAIFSQCGVLRGETLEEIFDYVKAFSSQPLPKGDKVAIVTNSGGPGILATDSCIRYGLNIASFSPTTMNTMKKILPPTASLNNPVDLIAEAQEEQYKATLRAILKDKNVHSCIIILTPTAFTDVEKIADTIVTVSKEFKKPVLCCFLGVYDVSKGIEILEENGIPDYRFPESAARVLSEMTKFTWWLRRPQTGVKKYKVNKTRAKGILDSVIKEGRQSLLEQESYEILKAYNFPVVESLLAENETQVVDAANTIGFPVVLKIASPDILHKFDFGGVKLNLKNKTEVRKAYHEILKNVLSRKPDAKVKGMIVEEMVSPGKEIIIGMSRDPQFGPILMFGLGGIYVEALEDVTFRLAPIRELTATLMITRTKTHKILEGFRGEKPYDIEAIAECLKRLSQLVTDFDEIKELDINPLIVYEKGKGCAIVDARIILGIEPSI